MGNPTPLFIIRGATVTKVQLLGAQNNHLKLTIEDQGKALDVIGFRLGELAEEMTPYAQVKLLGELQMNEWNGRRTPQLVLRDLSIPHLQIFDWRSNRVQLDRFDEMEKGTCLFVFTSPSSLPSFSKKLREEQIVFWSDLENQNWQGNTDGIQNLILVEPPPSLEIFLQGLRLCTKVERLYFMYGDADFDDLLVKVPTREQFKKLYSALVGKKPFSLTKHLHSLMRITGLPKRSLSFMIQVFEDCGFLRNENGMIHVCVNPAKKSLTESKLYQRQLAREQVLEKLVYSSYRELCDYLFTNVVFKWQMGGKSDELQRENSGDSRLSAGGNSF
jgi:single-stranded-DNA-specific exonuclease